VTADFAIDVWFTTHHSHAHNAAKSVASKIFRSMSGRKERSIRFDNLRFFPDHAYVVSTCAEAGEADPAAFLAKAKVIVTA
jgi:hypothetical protein